MFSRLSGALSVMVMMAALNVSAAEPPTRDELLLQLGAALDQVETGLAIIEPLVAKEHQSKFKPVAERARKKLAAVRAKAKQGKLEPAQELDDLQAMAEQLALTLSFAEHKPAPQPQARPGLQLPSGPLSIAHTDTVRAEQWHLGLRLATSLLNRASGKQAGSIEEAFEAVLDQGPDGLLPGGGKFGQAIKAKSMEAAEEAKKAMGRETEKSEDPSVPPWMRK